MNYLMKTLRQTLRFLILGAVLGFLFIGSKFLDNDKKNHSFTELIKPNEAKADVVGGASGSGSVSCGGSGCGCG